METSPTVSAAPNTAVAEVHWQGLLVMVVGCVAATTTVAAADSSARGRQSTGSLHVAAGLLEGQGARGLGRWVMNMVEEVMSAAVIVAVTVAVLSAAGLLGG